MRQLWYFGLGLCTDGDDRAALQVVLEYGTGVQSCVPQR